MAIVAPDPTAAPVHPFDVQSGFHVTACAFEQNYRSNVNLLDSFPYTACPICLPVVMENVRVRFHQLAGLGFVERACGYRIQMESVHTRIIDLKCDRCGTFLPDVSGKH